MSLEYLKITIKHKYYVFKAGRKLRLGIWQLLIHDWTKFLPSEYPYYQRWFFGDNKNPDEFAPAWLHHQNMNKHHWDYWITRTIHRIGVQGHYEPTTLPMPEKYVREMVADWMGASLAYTGKTDIQEWLNKNYDRMKLHPKTESRIHRVLLENGNYWPPRVLAPPTNNPLFTQATLKI